MGNPAPAPATDRPSGPEGQNEDTTMATKTFSTGNTIVNQLHGGSRLRVVAPGVLGFDTGNSTVAKLDVGTELFVESPGVVSYDDGYDAPDSTDGLDIEDAVREALRNIFAGI